MRKFLYVLWGIIGIDAIVVSSVIVHTIHGGKYEFAADLFGVEKTAVKMTEIAGLKTISEQEFDAEDIRMQIVYQLAKRSIVKVVVKDAAGSGVIWKIEGGIVIVSNRHLLMRDVTAKIVFGTGETLTADIVGYSQQYDIGFVQISEEAVTDNILRNIFEAVPALYEIESEGAKTEFAMRYSGQQILQVGALIDQNTANISMGRIKRLTFIPLFHTNMLETDCYSRAGMSGGGVFDKTGHFLGMISGGEVPEEAVTKEAKITYSIPPALIEAEYEKITAEILDR